MRTRVILLITAIILSAFTPALAATTKSGSKCAKKNAVTVSAGYKYKCVLVNRKLVWKLQGKVLTTPTPTVARLPTPTLIDVHYVDLVQLPDGSQVCPKQTGFVSSEVTLTQPESVYAQYRQRQAASGERVCLIFLEERVAKEFPQLPLSAEAEKAIASWLAFRKTRPEDRRVRLNLIIDPQGSPQLSARDVMVFRESASVFAPELGSGNITLVIGYSDDFINAQINSDKTFVTMGQAQEVWNQQGRNQQCYGNFWAPRWRVGEQKPTTLGDITLCNHRMMNSPAPDGAHSASHEFTHAVQDATRNWAWTESNMWWSEGGAFFYGSLLAADVGLLDLRRNRAFWVYQLATETQARTLEQLGKDESGSRRGGFLAVEYLASKYGVATYWDVMKKQAELLPPSSKGEPVGNLAAAFKAVTGQDFDAFVKEAEKYLVDQVATRMKN